MKPLSRIKEHKSVFILEIECEEYIDHLATLGIYNEKLITVIRSDSKKGPLLIEVDGTRVAIGKDIADRIFVIYVLDSRECIFDENYKQTKQRGVILEILKNKENHFSLEEITKDVQSKDERIGSITVYRTIKYLHEKNILDMLVLYDGSRRFEIHKGEHDHIICENCFSISDLMDEDIFLLQEQIAKKHKLEISHHNLKLFRKSCPKCKTGI